MSIFFLVVLVGGAQVYYFYNWLVILPSLYCKIRRKCYSYIWFLFKASNRIYCTMISKWYNKVLLFKISYNKVSFKRYSPYQGLFNILEHRSYSTSSSSIVLVKIYFNANTDNLLFLTENKGKAGVYR